MGRRPTRRSWIGSVSGALSGAWTSIHDTVLNPRPDPDADAAIARAASARAPIVWMLGKVGAGKTSIVRAMTGSSDAEIGTGYRACTRTARLFEFPAEAPVIRFLDTRGLGEARYDPTEDIAYCERTAHVMIVAVRAMDPQQAAIVEAVTAVRERHPDWPVIVAQTWLHAGYTGGDHPQPYPFADGGHASGLADLNACLAAQRRHFAALPGTAPVTFVPVDFTHPDDGYDPVDYGLAALWDAIETAAPLGLRAMLGRAADRQAGGKGHRARPHVIGYATSAAALDTLPGAGLVGVPVLQGKMLHSLGGIFGVTWSQRRIAEFVGCLGTGTALRIATGFGVRQLVKFVPVYGQIVGAVTAAGASFVTTYALGMAATHYLKAVRAGSTVDADGVLRCYREALAEAMALGRQRGGGPGGRAP